MFRWLARYIKRVDAFGVGVELRESPSGQAAEPPPPARTDGRTVFEYQGGLFVHLSEDRWVEKRSSGVDSSFKEVERTDDYIGLYDSDRKMAVRLYANRGVWFDTKTEQWVAWPGSEGKWCVR